MIPFLEDSNAGGVKFLQICRHDLIDWSSFPKQVNGNIANPIPLLPGGTWERINFPPKFTGYKEEKQDHRGFLGHTEFIIPRSRPYILDWFENRENFRYLMMVRNWNEDTYLVGRKEEPVKLNMIIRDTGNQPTARNGFTVELNCKLARRSPFFQYSTSVAFVDFLLADFFAQDFYV